MSHSEVGNWGQFNEEAVSTSSPFQSLMYTVRIFVAHLRGCIPFSYGAGHIGANQSICTILIITIYIWYSVG